MPIIAENVINLWNKKVIRLWNEWECRALVLLSLLIQVILIVSGSQRKRRANAWIRFIVWSVYLSVDWVASVALGVLAKSNTPKDPDSSIQSFWAPFLLLHLGGPDTITAYSLEDNELWPRHLLGLVIDVGATLYVSLRYWGYNKGLTFIAIPMFIAGIIKYGERTWVLRSSSIKQFRNSLLPTPDAGPDYAEYYKKKMMNKDLVALQPVMLLPSRDGKLSNDYLYQADYLFERLEYLFADLILGYNDGIDCHSMICDKSSEEAFTLAEVELGFLYDVLYTKATITYSWYGILFRCISFVSSAFALVAFSIIMNKLGYSSEDVFITYLLLVGAVVFEVYALVILICSDWTKLWLARHRKSSMTLNQVLMNAKRWSGTIPQYNLMISCLLKVRKKGSILIKVQKLLAIDETLERHQLVIRKNVDIELKELIFQQLLEKSKNIIEKGSYDAKLCKKLLTSRGDYVLEKMECSIDLKWSIVDVEFDHSLLLWHIATELCYYDDVRRVEPEDLETMDIYGQYGHYSISRCLSNYMLYLLVVHPDLLPKGIGELRYRDTCAEAIDIFKKKRDNEVNMFTIRHACVELLKESSPEEKKGDIRTKLAFFEGFRLARQLQSLYDQHGWSYERKLEMMNKVWVEMLSYTAIHCGWKQHAQQLRKGRELLSHVCLLMAHLGLSDQYQTEKQYFLRPSKYRPNPRLFEELLQKLGIQHLNVFCIFFRVG